MPPEKKIWKPTRPGRDPIVGIETLSLLEAAVDRRLFLRVINLCNQSLLNERFSGLAYQPNINVQEQINSADCSHPFFDFSCLSLYLLAQPGRTPTPPPERASKQSRDPLQQRRARRHRRFDREDRTK